ncbi:MAG: N-acetylmuramoyl-L-alanine amidase [Clostridia bacterium]|nr:N-acetylmuramoyl-L-alanine amidase [Clostridia bacterium]
MKKTLFVFAFIFTFIISLITSFAASGIKLYINGSEIKCDVAPAIVNGRTLVPARVVFENLNADVSWLASSRQVVITSGGTVIVFKIDSKTATVNNEQITMDCAPIIVQDRTMVPIRFVSEKLGYKVQWDDSAKKVSIDAPETETNCNILSVSVKENTDSSQVQIALSTGAQPKVMTLKEPFRICLDFEGAQLDVSDSKQNPDNGYITQVRWAMHDEYTRIVIECPGEQPYKISGEGTSAIIVTVGDKNSAVKPQQPDADSTPDVVTPPAQSPDTEQEQQPVQKVELTNIVVIDAGHGGKDVGAVGKDEEGNMLTDENGNPLLTEKELNLYIAQKIRDNLVSAGIKVVMTRDDDTYEGTENENLLARANLANNVNASLFLSVHNNSAVSPKATGTEVCYTPNSSGAYGVTSMEFAQNILTPLVNATGLTNRGLSSRPNLAVLKYTKMPAVLIECGFVTCETDRAVLMNKSKLDEIAKAVANGIRATLQQMNEDR